MQIRPGSIISTNAAYPLALFGIWLLQQVPHSSPYLLNAAAVIGLPAIFLVSAAYIARRAGKSWIPTTFLHVSAGHLVPAILIVADTFWEPDETCTWTTFNSHCGTYLTLPRVIEVTTLTLVFAIAAAVLAIPVGLLARRFLGTVNPQPNLPLYFGRNRAS